MDHVMVWKREPVPGGLVMVLAVAPCEQGIRGAEELATQLDALPATDPRREWHPASVANMGNRTTAALLEWLARNMGERTRKVAWPEDVAIPDFS